MTDDKKKRGLTNRRNLAQEDFEDDFEVDVRSERNGYLSDRPASVTDLRRGLDAAAVRSGDVAEVWVSPDGDDSNPGTRNAPFGSITAATDHVQERYPEDIVKRVRVQPGEYHGEEIVINHKHVRIVGEGQRTFDQKIEVSLDEQDGPILAMTNMTREAWEGFLEDGGVSHTRDSTNFDYTGPQLSDRETRDVDDLDSIAATIENLYFLQNTSDSEGRPIVTMVAADHDGDAVLRGVEMRNFNSYQIVDRSAGSIYMKNFQGVVFSNPRVIGDFIADNSNKINFRKNDRKSMFNFQDEVILRQGGDLSIEGNYDGGGFVGGDHEIYIKSVGGVKVYDDVSQTFHSTNQSHFMSLMVNDLEFIGDTGLRVRNMECDSFTKKGAGNLDVEFISADAGVNIQGGASNSIGSGVIGTDLTVQSPATAVLTNTVVRENIEGDGDVTQNGGGYLGSNNNTGTYTHNSLKTT